MNTDPYFKQDTVLSDTFLVAPTEFGDPISKNSTWSEGVIFSLSTCSILRYPPDKGLCLFHEGYVGPIAFLSSDIGHHVISLSFVWHGWLMLLIECEGFGDRYLVG